MLIVQTSFYCFGSQVPTGNRYTYVVGGRYDTAPVASRHHNLTGAPAVRIDDGVPAISSTPPRISAHPESGDD